MTAVLDPAISRQTFYGRSIDDDKIQRPTDESEAAPYPSTKYFSDFDGENGRPRFYTCTDEGIHV